MVVFEGKAFDEKKVVSIESGEDNSWSSSTKDRYYIKMVFTNGDTLYWNRYLPKTAISKIAEITELINIREEKLLKLVNP